MASGSIRRRPLEAAGPSAVGLRSWRARLPARLRNGPDDIPRPGVARADEFWATTSSRWRSAYSNRARQHRRGPRVCLEMEVAGVGFLSVLVISGHRAP